MSTKQLILAIEDNADDYRVLDRVFGKSSEFELVRSTTLTQALAMLSESEYALILLDLTLPDSDGIEAVSMLFAKSEAPVVVLTGLDNEEMAFGAVQLGAQDYLVKGAFDATLLLKTVRYSLERFRLVQELNESKILVQREQEQLRLQRSILSSHSLAAANANDNDPMRERFPDIFSTAVAAYQITVEHAVEQRSFKVRHDLSLELKNLASQIGEQAATPRDVVEIHTSTLTAMLNEVPDSKVSVVNEEGRYLLIEFLGHLCTFYRDYFHSLLPDSLESSGK